MRRDMSARDDYPMLDATRQAQIALDEIDRLRRWKAEALPLLALLDHCHELLPPDARAPLGHSKAEAVEKFLARANRPQPRLCVCDPKPNEYQVHSPACRFQNATDD